jgi:hypothetical protein
VWAIEARGLRSAEAAATAASRPVPRRQRLRADGHRPVAPCRDHQDHPGAEAIAKAAVISVVDDVVEEGVFMAIFLELFRRSKVRFRPGSVKEPSASRTEQERAE